MVSLITNLQKYNITIKKWYQIEICKAKHIGNVLFLSWAVTVNSYLTEAAVCTALGGYSVQKTLQGCAANMGSKISLLVYEWPLIKCKIWYMNGSIFQNLLKFGPKLNRLVYEWVTFSCKIGICLGLLSNSVVAHLYQNHTWVPPPPPPGHCSPVGTFFACEVMSSYPVDRCVEKIS